MKPEDNLNKIMPEPEKVISPFTGKKRCFVQKMGEEESYLCIDTGYTTNTTYAIGSAAIKDAESKAPKLINDLKYTDEDRGVVWFPSIVQVPGIGMIFPDGSSIDEWHYSVAKQIPIPEDEQKNYPITNKEGQYYQSRLDMDNLKTFANDEFEKACDELKIMSNVENI